MVTQSYTALVGKQQQTVCASEYIVYFYTPT